MKNYIIFLVGLLCFACIPANAQASADESYYADKVWTITFSTEVDPKTINEDTIYVTDASGQRVNNVKPLADYTKKRVTVDALDDYTPGDYTLHITNGVKNSRGEDLKQTMSKAFTIIESGPIFIIQQANYTDKQQQLRQNWEIYLSEKVDWQSTKGAYYLGENLYIVTTGTKPSGGYGIRLQKTITHGHQTEVYIEDIQPDPNLPQTSIIDHPHLLLKSTVAPEELSFLIDGEPVQIKNVPKLNPHITDLDAIKEIVRILNRTSFNVDMTGWTLVSTKGNQVYHFPEGFILTAWNSVDLLSGPRQPQDLPRTLIWTNENIWNNNGDTAQLYNAEGELVSEVIW